VDRASHDAAMVVPRLLSMNPDFLNPVKRFAVATSGMRSCFDRYSTLLFEEKWGA